MMRTISITTPGPQAAVSLAVPVRLGWARPVAREAAPGWAARVLVDAGRAVQWARQAVPGWAARVPVDAAKAVPEWEAPAWAARADVARDLRA